MSKFKNVIFFTEKLNDRAGGPSGYLANLGKGFKAAGVDIDILSKNEIKYQTSPVLSVYLLLSKLIPQKNIRRKIRRGIESKINSICPNFLMKVMKEYRFITCHSIYDVNLLNHFISENGLTNKIIFMSHSPEVPSLERYNFDIEAGLPPEVALQNKKRLEMEERKAIDSADYLIFPSKEAMEPYKETMEDFDDYFKNKEIVYIRTGCEALSTALTREEILSKYNLSDNLKTICYIGRHSSVKGYDNLKVIAQQILEEHDDCQFVIGGKLGKEITPLEHERWIELGFVNPAEILKISDLFILPNKRTYFDLILLEVLSSKTICLASNTGGNKTVYNETKAIQLYEDEAEAVQKIHSLLNQSIKERRELGLEAYRAYLENYSLHHFAKNYEESIFSLMSGTM